MDLETSTDTTALGDSDEEEVTSQTRRNLLMAQLYDSGLEVHDQTEGKDDDVATLLTSAEGSTLNDVNNMTQDMNALTLSEMDNTFLKLRQWRARNSHTLEQSLSCRQDSKGNDSDQETTEVSWIKEILALMETDGKTSAVDIEEDDESNNNGTSASASGMRDDSVFLSRSRASTLQKLQQLMRGLEAARSARADPGSSSSAAGVAFADLRCRLQEQEHHMSRERAQATRPSAAQAQGRQQQRDLHQDMDRDRGMQRAERKEGDSKEGTGSTAKSGSFHSTTTTTATATATATTTAIAAAGGKYVGLAATPATVFHDALPADEQPETDDGTVGTAAGVSGNGSGSCSDNNSGTITDKDNLAYEQRLDALMADEMDLNTGLDELGGQLASWADDLDSLFPEDAK